MRIYTDIFERIISPENLFAAWETFKKDKRNKLDVVLFERNLEENIFKLYNELKSMAYRHGAYKGFWIRDPKLRKIHKATVRDRVLHHAIYSVLNPIFESTFIATSFSCRIGKGNHKGVEILAKKLRQVSQNNNDRCFALKCDIKKFFDSIDHGILLGILKRKIIDDSTIWLLQEIIESFVSAELTLFEKRGVPIGNLTSQLFANVYMNKFDQFVKHTLKVENYVRYTDDFVIISKNREYLEKLLPPMQLFLKSKLHLNLHPQKVVIRKYSHGVDFLGYVSLPYYKIPRTKTKNRMFRKLRERVRQHGEGLIGSQQLEASLASYVGVLSHANAYLLTQNLKNQFWFWRGK